MDAEQLREELISLRLRMDPYFSPETSVTGKVSDIPSAGHCAVVALFVYQTFGGDLVSAIVEGQSHWFNRVVLSDGSVAFCDLTGDQFGKSPVQIDTGKSLYPDFRVRDVHELNVETLSRTVIFLTNMLEGEQLAMNEAEEYNSSFDKISVIKYC